VPNLVLAALRSKSRFESTPTKGWATLSVRKVNCRRRRDPQMTDLFRPATLSSTADGCVGHFPGGSLRTGRDNCCCTLRLVSKVCGWIATPTAATWIAGSRTIRLRPLSGESTTSWLLLGRVTPIRSGCCGLRHGSFGAARCRCRVRLSGGRKLSKPWTTLWTW
jgi:hypothetical protein